MKVEIGDYVIYSDRHPSFDLYRRYVSLSGKSKGQMVETVVGYFYDLEDALKALLREGVLQSDSTNLKEVLEVISATRAAIDRSLGLKNVRTRKETG